MNIVLPIHVAAGAAAIVLGAIALIVKKGGNIHRRSGLLFVYAMIVMGATASLLSFLQSAGATNLVAAILSLYFVGTALTTVRAPSRSTRVINVAALIVALALAILAIVGGVDKVKNPGLSPGGVPFRTIGVMSFVLATFLLLAAIGDVRVLRSGMPRGGRRLARHLWRMCFALFIAAGSFFSIRERVAKILPEPFTTGPMRLLPILLLFGAMFYWLWRVRRRGALPVIVRNEHARAVVVMLIATLAAACATTPVRDRRFDAIRTKLQRAVDEKQIASISVAVAIRGRIVWQEAFGWSDRERQIAATTETQYPIASITKPLTATAVMILDERGLLDIRKPLVTYLGNGSFKAYAADARAVTVRSTLQHRAGFAEHNQYYYPGDRRPPIEETIRKYAIVAYPPDEQYRYSNIGYGVLEALIERVSGTPYGQFMQQVFKNLGMHRTTVGPGDDSAVLHDSDLRPLAPYDFASRGAGYIFSTPADLIRFALVRDAKRERMLNERHSTGSATGRYGLDWYCGLGLCGRDQSRFSYAWYGHDGGMPGASTHLKIAPDAGVVVAALSNSRQQLTYDVVDEILDVVLPQWASVRRGDPALFPAASPPAAIPVARYDGQWRGDVVTEGRRVPVTVTISEGSMRVKIGEQPEVAAREIRITETGVEGSVAASLPLELPADDYELWLEVEPHDAALIGTLSAYSAPPRYHFLIPASIELRKTTR